eukprot:UN05399
MTDNVENTESIINTDDTQLLSLRNENITFFHQQHYNVQHQFVNLIILKNVTLVFMLFMLQHFQQKCNCINNSSGC